MATEPTPTDAEIDALIAQHWPAFATVRPIPLPWLRAAFRDGLTRWGAQPAPAASPVPLTDEQIDEMHGEANRGYCIEHEHYVKAVRDTEAVHGITKGA